MPKMSQTAIDKAQRIRETLDSTVTRVRSDPSLSVAGERQRVAAAYAYAASAMRDITTLHEGFAAVRAADLTQQLFGSDRALTGSDAISARDAADRAARLETPGEANALLHRAETNNDHVLARAIAGHAFEQAQSWVGGAAWAPVVDQYTQSRPDVADKLQHLADARSNGIGDVLANAGQVWLDRPDELGRLTDEQIATVASTDVPVVEPRETPPARVGGAWS